MPKLSCVDDDDEDDFIICREFDVVVVVKAWTSLPHKRDAADATMMDVDVFMMMMMMIGFYRLE